MTALTLKLDSFGRRLLPTAGEPLETVVSRALDHLDSEAQRGRAAATPPRFLTERAEAEFSVPVDASAADLERLQREADRSRLPMERIAEHALLLYLADERAGA